MGLVARDFGGKGYSPLVGVHHRMEVGSPTITARGFFIWSRIWPRAGARPCSPLLHRRKAPDVWVFQSGSLDGGTMASATAIKPFMSQEPRHRDGHRAL